jgi:dihydropteroate synthase
MEAVAVQSKQRTLVMGIVNVTPDSFSDGGCYFRPSDAIRHAYQLIEEGADIIDVGAESTRPGATVVSADEEWRRLEPVLVELTKHTSVVISVDTYKANVADRALSLGVHMINDVWGGLADPDMARVVRDSGCDYIWMHNRHTPAPHDAFGTLVRETKAGIERFLEAGVKKEKLWIDPGIGFGKTYEQNLSILKRLEEYCQFEFPVLLGTSRKSVIGNTLGLPPSERLEGSLATVAVGVWAGVRAVRVHDVKSTVRVCRMVEAIRDVNADA